MEVEFSSKCSFHKTVLVSFCLAVCATGLLTHYIQHNMVPTYDVPKPHLPNKTNAFVLRTNQEPKEEKDFCKFQPSSAPESLEELHILESIAWPQTPPFRGVKTTNARGSSFSVSTSNGGQPWRVGDELKVRITMKDFRGKPKTTGGDVLVCRIYNILLRASVSGKIIDHGNGSYTAVFPLLWAGVAQIEVTLLHPSEAVTVIRRLNKEIPDRVYFKSIFRLNSVTETMPCNYCLRPTDQPVCDFTDVLTGEPWFCLQPKKLGCETRISHSMGGFTEKPLYRNKYEKSLFKSGISMKVKLSSKGPAFVKVSPQSKAKHSKEVNQVTHSGYYYGGDWQALDGTKVQHFRNPTAMSKCLQGKKIYIFGDSTVRQWYEYLVATLPGLRNFDFHNGPKTGPYMATDYANNIYLHYRAHGPPIRSRSLPISELRFVANELNNIMGGPNTVVILGIWAHFGSFPHELYLRRLQRIRNSVVQMLNRSPGTLVIIRTGNIKDLSFTKAVYNSDWTTMQHNKILRAVFQGVAVRWVDAWEMTLAYSNHFLLHPVPPIIRNMVDVILSYTCPAKIK